VYFLVLQFPGGPPPPSRDLSELVRFLFLIYPPISVFPLLFFLERGLLGSSIPVTPYFSQSLFPFRPILFSPCFPLSGPSFSKNRAPYSSSGIAGYLVPILPPCIRVHAFLIPPVFRGLCFSMKCLSATQEFPFVVLIPLQFFFDARSECRLSAPPCSRHPSLNRPPPDCCFPQSFTSGHGSSPDPFHVNVVLTLSRSYRSIPIWLNFIFPPCPKLPLFENFICFLVAWPFFPPFDLVNNSSPAMNLCLPPGNFFS